MIKYFIYQYSAIDKDKTSSGYGKGFTENHYYRVEQEENENLKFVGTIECENSFFCATTSRYYDHDRETLSRKSLNKIYRETPDGELKGIIGDYIRLKFSYIPQLLKHFNPDPGGYYTPHRSKLKEV